MLAVAAGGEAAAQSTDLFQPAPIDPRNAQMSDPLSTGSFTKSPQPAAQAAATIPPSAGDTGFDSSGKKKKKKRRPGELYPVPKPKKPPPPVLNGAPQRAPAPQFGARGAYSGIYRPSDALPLPPRPVKPYSDPFDPVGIRAGSFLLKPAIEIGRGFDTNPTRAPTGPKSSFLQVQSELLAKSDWSQHELTATLRGSYLRYDSLSAYDRPSADMRVNGRIDVLRDLKVNLEARYLVGTDYPGSPNLPAGFSKLPIYTTMGTSAGITKTFDRLELRATGTFDRNVYQRTELTDGTTVSNESRNYNQYGLQLRAGYEVSPGLKPFVQVEADQRVHDLEVDFNNERRDSHAFTPRVGASFEVSRILTGEVSVGYVDRHYKDPGLADLRGVVADASLTWLATGLTTLILTAKSYADESILPGVSGALRRDINFQVDHALRRWLIASLKFGVGFDDYVGLGRNDTRTSLGMAITYKLSREIWLKSEIRQDWLKSNQPGIDNSATSILVGVRLQR